MVVQEVLSGVISKEAAKVKYGIKGNSAVLQWMRKFGVSTEKELTNSFVAMKGKRNQKQQQQKDQRIKLLEKALQMAELKAEGYSKMIEIAEQKLNIKIRKKSFTKQSKK